MKDNSSDKNLSVDLLEAKQIRLVDDNGSARADMICGVGRNNSGFVVFHLYDSDGRPRISLQVDDEEGASIQLWNKGNSPCVELSVLNERGNGISVCDSEGIPRIRAGGKQAMEISMRNSEGDVVWEFET